MAGARTLAVAVLAYNEEATLSAAVEHVVEALEKRCIEFEVLVIDDGSSDGTAGIARDLERRYDRVRLLSHGRNLGPGSGILTGIAHSTSRYFTFYAADMQGDFAERLEHFERLGRDADILVGQRPGRPGTSAYRRLTSTVFVRSMRALYGIPFDDFNFFYFFSREVLDAVRPQSRSTFICPELLVRALDLGFRVAAVPGTVRPRRSGRATVGNPRHVARAAVDMLRLWGSRHACRAAVLARALAGPRPARDRDGETVA